MQEFMIVHLNGDQKSVETNISVNTALNSWQLNHGKFALAINNEFLPRSQYSHYQLKPGDCIDLLTPVAGG